MSFMQWKGRIKYVDVTFNQDSFKVKEEKPRVSQGDQSWNNLIF